MANVSESFAPRTGSSPQAGISPATSTRLLNRYFNGDLCPDECKQFMDAFLGNQDLYNAFAEELIFTEMLNDPSFRAKAQRAARPQPRGIARLIAFLRDLSAAWRMAGMAAATALLLLSALALYRAQHHDQRTVARAGPPPTTGDSALPAQFGTGGDAG